jgi:hypothetical protein
MRWYSKKNRHITLTPRELYRAKRDKQHEKIKKNVFKFGTKFIRGEYTARIVLFGLAIAVLAGFAIIPLYTYSLVEREIRQHDALHEQLIAERYVFENERNIVIPSTHSDRAENVAVELAVLQNEYILAVLSGEETFTHIDLEMFRTGYLQNISENTSWFSLRELKSLRETFLSGDFHWAGYADNSLQPYDTSTIPVFFVLYDSGFPVHVVEYKYDAVNDVLRNRREWG